MRYYIPINSQGYEDPTIHKVQDLIPVDTKLYIQDGASRFLWRDHDGKIVDAYPDAKLTLVIDLHTEIDGDEFAELIKVPYLENELGEVFAPRL